MFTMTFLHSTVKHFLSLRTVYKNLHQKKNSVLDYRWKLPFLSVVHAFSEQVYYIVSSICTHLSDENDSCELYLYSLNSPNQNTVFRNPLYFLVLCSSFVPYLLSLTTLHNVSVTVESVSPYISRW